MEGKELPNYTTRPIAERLEAARALVAKLEVELEQERIRNNIQVGDDVTFGYGRAETRRELAGTVSAIGEESNPFVAITSGEGLDLKVYKVRASDVTENRTAATRDATGTDPLDAA